MIKKLLGLLILTFASVCAFAVITLADTVDINVDSSDGYDASCLSDDDYYTTDYYRTGTVLTVTSETPMEYLYIMWDSEPGEWTLTVNGSDTTCGKNNFLHELVKLPEATKEAKITIKEDRTYIADIYGISGSIPSWVQDWKTSYDKADVLVISAHSDDEILFMGGLIATYVNGGDYRVQVAYLCDLSLTERYRQHEQLNGLWAIGIRHYPQLGEFVDDLIEDDMDATYELLGGYDKVLEYMTRTIRRFKPQVIVTHDFDGEYGHPEHRAVAETVADALEITGDSSKYSESANKYGTWDVPKAYFHLYDVNQIELNLRIPLDDFGGRTAVEAAADAYKEHNSQQWMWFYVSDGYDDDGNVDYSDERIAQINSSLFGLYRTTVGADTGNDIMEHITSYDVQDAQAAAQTEETAEPVTDEKGETIETQPTQPQTDVDGSTVTAETKENTTPKDPENKGGSAIKTILIIIAVIVGVLIILLVILLIAAAIKRKKERERRRRRAAQRRKQQLQQQNRQRRP